MLKTKPCDETEIDIKYSCVHNKLLRNGTHDLSAPSFQLEALTIKSYERLDHTVSGSSDLFQ